MLTAVERVLILQGVDLLKDLGPRHLLRLADVAREVELTKGEIVYREDDPADAIYMVVEGRVRLATPDRTPSEVGPGESFGTWALVDDTSRGHRAECLADGLALALHRAEFYDLAAGDLALLQQLLRALARRLRALVVERPEEARVEGEGIEKPEAMVVAEGMESVEPDQAEAASEPTRPSTAGAALEAAVQGDAPPTTDSLAPAPTVPANVPEGSGAEPIVPVSPPDA